MVILDGEKQQFQSYILVNREKYICIHMKRAETRIGSQLKANAFAVHDLNIKMKRIQNISSHLLKCVYKKRVHFQFIWHTFFNKEKKKNYAC